MRGGIARLPEHADHDTAIVAAPGGAVRRQRIGAIALVAVDGWRGERGGRSCVRKQTAEKIATDRGQHVAIVERKGVDVARLLDQRLMQMPAARYHVRQ